MWRLIDYRLGLVANAICSNAAEDWYHRHTAFERVRGKRWTNTREQTKFINVSCTC